jgi:hypothetical protein
MKLHFFCRGQEFIVDGNGDILRTDISGFSASGQWKFIGVSTHNWHNRVTIPFSAILKNPALAVGGYVWDVDHGTTRTWGGQYCGKVPRITSAWVE